MPPHSTLSYTDLIRSLFRLAVDLPKLRQVSTVAALFFAGFAAFWTTLVYRLQSPPYHYGAQAAGLFGIIGASGAAAAGISGRLADQRGPRFVIGIALQIVLASWAVFWLLGDRLWGLALGVVLLDIGVQGAQVANQTRVLGLRPEARNRVNTVYMIVYFSGGSLGSLLGTLAWGSYGWTGVCAVGATLVAMASVVFAWSRTRP